MADTVKLDRMEKLQRLEVMIGPERQHRFWVVQHLLSLAHAQDILNQLI
jgi:hypothetical protein